MPPKKKKLDPAQQEAAFEEWKLSEEYLHMNKIRELLKKMPKEGRISTTDQYGNDLPGDWQPVLDSVFELFKIMKIKTGKIKGIEQVTVRSILFGKEDKEDEIIKVDGIQCGVTKAYADDCDMLRHKLITDCIDKIRQDVPDWMAENYQANLKLMQKSMKEFIKFYKNHIKPKGGGHTEIFEYRMFAVLSPLKNLIDINAKYRKFLADNLYVVDKEIRDFKLRAIEEKYILYFQDVMRILYAYTPDPPLLGFPADLNLKLRCTPDIHRLFYKINLTGWENSNPDKHYLQPLKKCFRNLQNTLFQMWYDKVNHWKLPLWKNVQMVLDIKALINAEMIAERLMGNVLKRDQLNFIYNTVAVIYKSNDMVQKFLLEKDPNTTENCIPKLVIYHQIQHMRKWKDSKARDMEKNAILNETMAELNILKEKEAMKSPIKQAGLNISLLPVIPGQVKPLGEEQKSPTKKDKKKVEVVVEEEKTPEQLQFEEDEKEYGRYWIMENYIDDKHKQMVEECVESIRHINPAVQQDIEDKIIQEGLEPRFKDRKDVENYKKAKDAQQKTQLLKQQQNDQIEINNVRPPMLWNYPKIVEKEAEHQFRAIAEPKESYIDRRFENFDQKLEDIKSHLVKYNKDVWDYLVDKVIDVFRNEYEADPGIKLSNAEFHIDFPHILKYGKQYQDDPPNKK